jgi:uridine kinase
VSGRSHRPPLTADLVASWPLGKSLVVGIAGGSASGKSLIAQELVSQVGSDAVAVLEHDGYYHHRPDLPFEDRAAINYDHPDSFETDLMLEHMEDLLAGRRVLKPRYDFAAHLRMDETAVVDPRAVILIEGLMILAEPELRRRCDLKIYVDADADLRLLRRLRRDTRDRGRTFASVIDQYEATVRPMHLQFVEPSKRYADIIIPEGFKPSAVRTVGGMLRDHLRQSPLSTVSTP